MSYTSYIGKVHGNIAMNDEGCHFLDHLSAPCLKPWGLGCHQRIWTAVKIPKPVLLSGLPAPKKFYDFTDSRGILLIRALGNDGGLTPG